MCLSPTVEFWPDRSAQELHICHGGGPRQSTLEGMGGGPPCPLPPKWGATILLNNFVYFCQTDRCRNFIFVMEVDHDNQHRKGWVGVSPCPCSLNTVRWNVWNAWSRMCLWSNMCLSPTVEFWPDRSAQELHICHGGGPRQSTLEGMGGGPPMPLPPESGALFRPT
jgi:hypothetical protein